MASRVTNTSLSIHHRILHILSAAGWSVANTGVPLKRQTNSDMPHTYVVEAPLPLRQWVYWNQSGVPCRDQVKVYSDGDSLDRDSYRVNHIQGEIYFDVAPSGSLTVDYHYIDAEVREGFPDDVQLETAELPVVSFEIEDETEKPFALGTSAGWQTSQCAIHILARTDREKKDLGNYIKTGFKFLRLYDFKDAYILDEYGDVNPSFNAEQQFKCLALTPQKPQVTYASPSSAFTPKEKHKAIVLFSCTQVD